MDKSEGSQPVDNPVVHQQEISAPINNDMNTQEILKSVTS